MRSNSKDSANMNIANKRYNVYCAVRASYTF